MKTISIQSFKGGTGKYLVILALIKTVKKELQIY